MTARSDPAEEVTAVAQLLARARALLARPGRTLLGITGAPGSGKSTLAAAVAAQLGEEAVVVPMDGFHLADEQLRRLGRADRKGAPDTFDADGYIALLSRLRRTVDRPVFAPCFDRSRELAVAAAIAVEPRHRLVITEGNYLLVQDRPWHQVRPLLDEVWFLDVDEQERVAGLLRRHVFHGRTPSAAEAWVEANDQANAVLVQSTRTHADVIARLSQPVSPTILATSPERTR